MRLLKAQQFLRNQSSLFRDLNFLMGKQQTFAGLLQKSSAQTSPGLHCHIYPAFKAQH